MFGGESMEAPPPKSNGPCGLYVQPTTCECINADVEISREEIFGSVASVLRFDMEY
jgi:acyl-CoA reductase-like NAD-dependent aldehyde dehydrogenase